MGRVDVRLSNGCDEQLKQAFRGQGTGSMIRMGPHPGHLGSGKRDAVEGAMEDQEAVYLASDWADISQGLRKYAERGAPR